MSVAAARDLDLAHTPKLSNLLQSTCASIERHALTTLSPRDTTANMSQQALNKIAPNSPSRAKPSEIETNIATALYELETNIPDMKSALRPLQFVSAREVR